MNVPVMNSSSSEGLRLESYVCTISDSWQDWLEALQVFTTGLGLFRFFVLVGLSYCRFYVSSALRV